MNGKSWQWFSLSVRRTAGPPIGNKHAFLRLAALVTATPPPSKRQAGALWESTPAIRAPHIWPAELLAALSADERARAAYGLQRTTKYRVRAAGYASLLMQCKRNSVICGAKTRKGTPCQMRPIRWSQRCRLHGGLSTGPMTAEGRERIGDGAP